MMPQTLRVDDLAFQVHFSDQRKSLGLTLERDGSLVITAPTGSTLAQIEQFARQKQFWVYTKLAEKEMLGGPEARMREFVNGEGFYYLGRSYQLRLVEPQSQPQPLRLWYGHFCLRKDCQDQAEKHFVHWYIEHGQPWIASRVDLYARRIGVQPTAVTVTDLGYRWGSCSPSGKLNFHWRTVCLPSRIIEYVVVHELVHLHEPNHGEGFWQRLRRAMPDFRERASWLAKKGAGY